MGPYVPVWSVQSGLCSPVSPSLSRCRRKLTSKPGRKTICLNTQWRDLAEVPPRPWAQAPPTCQAASSYLKLRPPPQTPPTRAGTLGSDPAHHSSRPRPCPPPALKASCCRGVRSEPSGLPSALAATPVVRVRGVADRVSPAARTWYSRAVGAVGSCSPGRAFQIVPGLTCTDMEGRLLRGLPAQQVSEAGDWRAGAWREIGNRACSVALHAPRLHPRRRLRPGLEKV